MHWNEHTIVGHCKKNYARCKYAPGLVLILASHCCPTSFSGGCVGIIDAAICRVTVLAAVPAGVLCVCCTGIRCTGICCAGACRAGIYHAGVQLITLACALCWCVCHAGVFIMPVCSLCQRVRHASVFVVPVCSSCWCVHHAGMFVVLVLVTH